MGEAPVSPEAAGSSPLLTHPPGREYRRHTEGFAELKVRRYRGDDDTRVHSDQVDTRERQPDPGINDDALIQDAIKTSTKLLSAETRLTSIAIPLAGQPGPTVTHAYRS